MEKGCLPDHYSRLRKRFQKYFEALDGLGEQARRSGPIDDKTAHLVQLAAAAAIRSEGSVHSHARRAILAGATNDELYHALLLITSTVGFPTVAAAVSWLEDVIENK